MAFSIQIICFSSRKKLFDTETERYKKLIRPFIPLSIVPLKPVDNTNKRELLKSEEKKMCKKWIENSYPIALSEEGNMYSSVSFSKWLSKRVSEGKTLVFNIGSSHGISSSLKSKCSEIISLSPMTLPNRMCLVVLIEQLYRAFTILRGHPYHK